MKRQYPKLKSENDIYKQVLYKTKIDIYEPEIKKEEPLAEALGAFSFVLREEPSKCQTILDNDTGGTVGELQGCNIHYRIYRVSIPEDVVDKIVYSDAALVLLREFHSSRQGKRYGNVLTIKKLKQRMLGMFARRANERGYRT